MAKAPISQTVFLTEDGTAIPVTSATAVTIPPLLLPTIANTLASSTLVAATVVGLPALFIALYARLTVIAARAEALRLRCLALTTRISALES
jgi:hypothetical protein